MTITLTYFPIRGRVEASRLALEYAGADYVTKVVSFEQMPEIKSSLPYGQLPLYEDEQVRIAQSNAILRHVGRAFSTSTALSSFFFLTVRRLVR